MGQIVQRAACSTAKQQQEPQGHNASCPPCQQPAGATHASSCFSRKAMTESACRLAGSTAVSLSSATAARSAASPSFMVG